jgi:uncharacterized protein (TIGR03032 family)
LTKLQEVSDSAFLQVHSSDGLWEWLKNEQISIGFTTYQTNRLMLVGRNVNGRLTINERLFDKPMGLYAQADRLYMSTRYQIWQLDNHLAKGETYQEADRLYVPSQSYTTGSLNVHDLVLDRNGTPIFINTDFSCLATIQAGYSFAPIWQPPFITKLVAEDRCHLNGLAMVDGEPAYVTACSMTDSAAGWRAYRNDGGIVMHIPSNEVVVGGLSMPHSPRWYQGKLCLLNAGTGDLGYVDDHKFVPIAFCQGFVRGLAFWGDLAIVGLSKLRSASFSGLVLEERLLAEGKTAQCGLMAINIHSGEIVHSLFLEQPIEELFDVVVLPNVVRPMSLGFQDEDIERLVTFPSSNGLVTTKPTVKRPSDVKPAIAGLPTKERVDRENQESRQYEALERQEQLTGAQVKFQRVFHLNPESLAPYDAMTFPSLQQRWQSQPQRGEVIGVSASVLGDMVGFAIAELLPNLKAEIISLFVDPNHRQKGVGTRMLAFLEREIWSQKFEQIAVVYAPTSLTEKGLESMLRKLGWAAPRSLDNGFKVALKGLATVNPPISEAAKVKFEEGKDRVKEQDLDRAIACFQAAIALQPDYVAAYNQLGNALQTLEKSDEAIAAYQKILEINPNVAVAHCNLGSIWQTQEKYEEAIAAYQRAIQLKPDFALAYQNLGRLFEINHNFAEWRQSVDRYAENCAATDRINVLVMQIRAYLQSGLTDIAQQHFQQLESILLQENGVLQEYVRLIYENLVFSVPYLRDRIDLNGYFNKLIGTAYIQQCLQPVKELELAKTSLTTINKSDNKSEKDSSEHLRIGIISRHFRRHSIGWCSRDIIRELSKLTPHLYLYVTGSSNFDDIAEDFSQMTDSFFDFSSQSNLSLLEKLRADSLDILIDMDSLMSPSHALILHHAPAKVVLSWLGCEPPYISQENYYLCDRYTHPESVQSHYQEKLIRMPDFAMAIAGFSSKDIDRESLRRDLGLAPKSIVYLSVASGQKINLDSIRSHISILRQVPDSVLIHKGSCDVEVVRSLYERECLKAGIDPQRCQFLPFQKSEEDHRVVYQIADVALDTYPYNGGTHNLECLWFNLPLVTLCGEQAVSRMGYSFLTAVGISEGIAKNWEEYIDWGVKLGTNLDLRLQLQQQLHQSKQKETLSSIWNPQKFALDAYTLFQALEKKAVQKALLPIANPSINEAAKFKFEEGKDRVKEQDLDRAVISFREAIALQPDYVAAYNQLGNALQGLGRSDEAIAAYQKILEINPNVAAAHCNLGSIWQTQEKYELAIAAYQRAIALKPDFALAYRNLSGLVAKDLTD